MTIRMAILVDNTPRVMFTLFRLFLRCEFQVTKQKEFKNQNGRGSIVSFIANGTGSISKLSEQIMATEGVIKILKLVKGEGKTLIAPKSYKESPQKQKSDESLKSQCKTILKEIFGEGVAKTVDNMSESECVALCRAKVAGLVGEEQAKVFDNLT